MPNNELPNLTQHQAKYVDLVANYGLTKAKAAIEAGYSPGVNPTMIEKSGTVKNALCQALTRRGLTEDYIAKRLMQGTMSYDKRFYSYEGKVIDSRKVPDFGTREKYLKTILEVQGYIKNNSIENLNIGLITMPSGKQDEEWNKVEPDQSANTTENK